jgi:hypothetical protein
MTDHSFETCTDPDCHADLCGHYRAGLAAGHDFMARGLARGSATRGAQLAVETDGTGRALEAPGRRSA